MEKRNNREMKSDESVFHILCVKGRVEHFGRYALFALLQRVR